MLHKDAPDPVDLGRADVEALFERQLIMRERPTSEHRQLLSPSMVTRFSKLLRESEERHLHRTLCRLIPA
jgi:hypothetical protein